MKEHIIPACIAALLMLIVLSICLTFCHSSSDRSDDVDAKPKETTVKRIETGSSEQTAAYTTATSTVTEAPEVIQSVEVIVRDVADQVKLRVGDEELLVFGKQITYGGNVLDVESKNFFEGGTRYSNTVILEGNALYEKPLYITPCKQNWTASFYYQTELINMRTWVSDAEEICFDSDTGITLKGFCGDFGFTVTPVRGGTMTFAYGQDLTMYGMVDEPTDITLKWEGQSLSVSSGEEIHHFNVPGYKYEAPPAAKQYKVTYTLAGTSWYEPTIEVIGE